MRRKEVKSSGQDGCMKFDKKVYSYQVEEIPKNHYVKLYGTTRCETSRNMFDGVLVSLDQDSAAKGCRGREYNDPDVEYGLVGSSALAYNVLK
ncbi:Uu.00g068540.m01.CDS01 [Anthostomella pinea]|uniref:Uu.00g068540.m01.CDS01 n=1 Tax=Anthostomella pinea TaxID=933095 RepID=A0AAI8VUD2_9PEZI|nr:Uu.00g068540.m01.CDS01 [Anthostomella pinea]